MIKCTLARNYSNHILHEDLKDKWSVWSLFHTVSWMSNRSTGSPFMKISSRPVSQIHTFWIAFLLETSIRHFSMILKQYIESWSGEQNHHPHPKNFPMKSWGWDGCWPSPFLIIKVNQKYIQPEGKTVNSVKYTCGVGKDIQEWQLVPFAKHFSSPFCHKGEAFPCESWLLTKGNCPCSSQLSSIPYSENHLQRKIPSQWGPQEEDNCQMNCCSFGCLWGLFCATFKKVYKMCCSQGRLLKNNIRMSFLLHMCMFTLTKSRIFITQCCMCKTQRTNIT